MDQAENELLTRIGPGTRMGAVMRRYWWPVGLSQKVDKVPVPIRLLGEDLILFRTPSGKVGLIDRFCAHRLTSLEHGRDVGAPNASSRRNRGEHLCGAAEDLGQDDAGIAASTE